MLRVFLVPLVLVGSAALPLRRALARGSILSTCNKPWKGCPEAMEEKLTGFSEAMAMYQDSSSKSDESASTSARAGENGLDRAASKVFATSVAATMARLQLYQNDVTKGGIDEEEAAQGCLDRASWWLFQFLAILLDCFGTLRVRKDYSVVQ